MKRIDEILEYLKAYDGPKLKLMEVCGTHTVSIFKNGIRSLISDKIKLISGPGCPVCVTPAAYVDHIIQLARREDHVVLTFGDMMKVPGSQISLSEAKAEGARVEMLYSPFEILSRAISEPGKIFVMAAVGFETTIPAYGLLIQQAIEKGVKNIRLVTALKTVIPALSYLCEAEQDIDAFICPGHASIIEGVRAYEPLAQTYHKPFVITGFESEHILISLYDILKQLEEGSGKVHNFYTSIVRDEGNEKAKKLIETYFEPGDAIWRGIGKIENSGMYLKEAYREYDGGSFHLDEDVKRLEACRCGEVILGRINPDECPLFGKVCTPTKAQGPCMVSSEGSCGIWYKNTVH